MSCFVILVLLHRLIIVYFRFLAYVDLLGTTYSASTLATGYGSYIAQPLLRRAVEGNENTLTEDQARKILEDSLRVLFYRDARSLNKVRFSYIVDRDFWLIFRSIKLLLLRLKVLLFRRLAIWKRLGHLLREYGVTELRHSDNSSPFRTMYLIVTQG